MILVSVGLQPTGALIPPWGLLKTPREAAFAPPPLGTSLDADHEADVSDELSDEMSTLSKITRTLNGLHFFFVPKLRKSSNI